MKRFIIFLVFVVVLVIGGAVVAPNFIDWNSYKGQAVSQIKKTTGLDVALNGDIGFSFFPSPKVMASDVAVKSPEGAKYDHIATLKRFDVHVALMPLISGKVDVQSVALIEPVINIEVDKDGKLILMTEELNALSSGTENGASAQSSSGMPEISFQNIEVKDAALTYFDHKSGQEQKLSNINFDLSASSLAGPYKLDGHLFHEGRALNIDLETGAVDLKEKVISVKSMLSVSPDNVSLNFAGAFDFSENMSAQGQVKFEADPKTQFISKPIKGQALLTADKASVKLTELQVASEGDISISGDAAYDIINSKFAANLKSGSAVKAKTLLGPAFPFESVAFDLSASGDNKKISVKDSILTLDQSKVKFSADYDLTGKTKLVLALSSDSLDLSNMASGGSNQKQSAKQALKTSVQSLALPFDLDFAVNAKALKYPPYDLRDLAVDAKISGNTVTITNFKGSNLYGMTVGVKGNISDIKALTGIKLDTQVAVDDIKSFKSAFKLEENAQVDLLDKASIASSVSGSLEAMDITSNITTKGANIYLKGKATDPLDKLAIFGLSVQVKHPNTQKFLSEALGFADMGYDLSKALDFYTDFAMSDNSYTLNNIKASVSGIPLSGKMDILMKEKRPYVQGQLNAGLVRLVSKSGASGGGVSSGERWSKEPIETSGLSAVDADITFSADKIHKDLIVITRPSFALKMQDGVLDIKDLKGGIFEGAIAANITVQSVPNEKRQPLHITAKGQMTDIDLRDMTQVLVGRNFINAEGTVNSDFDIKTSGLNQAALIYDLSGKATLMGKEITIHGIDIKRFAKALATDSKAGDSVLGLWKTASKGGSTYFDTLDGGFTINEGIVNIEKLDLDGPQAYLQTQGTVSLPQWTLNTKHRITPKIEVEGEKEIPPFELSFSGSLDNPSQTFGQGLLQDYINRKINRKINDILTDAIGGKAPNNNAPQEQPAAGTEEQPQQQEQQELPPQKRSNDPEDLIKDVLKDLLR